jgi:hypothetical protein
MDGLARRAIEYRMLFPNVTSVWDLLDSLSPEPGVNLRMPPDRFTRKEFPFEVEGSGAPVQIRKAIHRCAQCGVEVTAIRGHQCLIQIDPPSTRRVAS